MHKFCETVDLHVLQNSHRSTALCIGGSPSDRIQATFLLGAYLVMRHALHPDEAMQRLAPVLPDGPAVFRGPFDSQSNSLPLRDCLAAMHRSRALGWVSFSEIHSDDAAFDPDEYAHYDSPLNADLHELVPGRIVAAPCPRALPAGAAWADRRDAAGRFVARDFSPAFAADLLAQFDAALCVRVVGPCGDGSEDGLVGAGLGPVLDLPCGPGSAPDPDTVARFLATADAAAPRAVALLEDGGRQGPAGALAGAYLVRRHGFSACEAAAWLRIVRPGCVSGEELPFLRAQEEQFTAAAAAVAAAASSAAPTSSSTQRPCDPGADSFSPPPPPGSEAGNAAAGFAWGLRRSGPTGRLSGLVGWVGRWGL